MIFRREIGVGLTALCLGVVVIAATGGFASVDRWLFDRMVTVQPLSRLSAEEVLVVAARGGLEPDEVLKVGKECHEAGARITLIYPSQGLLPKLDMNALARLGAQLSPAWASPPPMDGIYRGGGPSIESTVGILAKKLGRPVPKGNYYFDFRVPVEGIQVVDLERFLADDVPASLLERKVVLLGELEPREQMITTPVHRGAEALHPLMYQAVAADSYVRGGFIEFTQVVAPWVIGLVLAAGLGIWLWRREFHSAIGLGTAAVVAILLSSWVVLWALNLWFTPAVPGSMVALVGLAAAGCRESAQRHSLERLLRNLAVETRERAQRPGFLNADSPWEFVEMAFGNNFAARTGFALAAVGTSPVRLISVSNEGQAICDRFFSIGELRADRGAFAESIQMDQATTEDGLTIVPIRTPGRLYGFWVFSPLDESSRRQAIDFGHRVATMIEHRDTLLAQNSDKIVSTRAADAVIRPLHDQLEGAIKLLEEKRMMLAESLDRSREAVLVYDPFGDLEYASAGTGKLLDKMGIAYTGVRSAQLLESLTNASGSEIRTALLSVSLYREGAALKCRSGLVPGREFFIRLRPLQDWCGNSDDGLPGAVMLIQDVTQLGRAALLKDEFIERVYYQLNNDFESMIAASSLLMDKRVTEEQRAELTTMVTEKIGDSTNMMRRIRAHFKTEFSPVVVERFPIRFDPVIRSVQAQIAEEIGSRNIGIEADVSSYIPLVLAAPEPLCDVLHAIFLTLIHDARDDSKLCINVTHRESKLVVRMENQGFGMPQHKLDDFLESRAGGHDVLDHIGEGRETVAAWGGSLTVRSEVGTGMKFDLSLACVV